MLAITLQLHAIIFESNKLEDIYKHANKNSIVVFDIDDTIAAIPTGLGQWLDYKIDVLQKKGFSAAEAIDLTLPMFFTIVNCAGLEPIGNSPKVIKKLQRKKIPIIALTKRSFPIIERTVVQLKNIGIDFSKRSLCKKSFDLNITHRGRFTHGIISVGPNNKGDMLFSFLEKVGHTPKKVIFIEDQLKYVKAVEKACEEHGVEFVGIRFSLQDEAKKCPPAVIEEKMHELRVELGLAPLDQDICLADNISNRKLAIQKH